MKALLADKLSPIVIDGLTELGFEVVDRPELSAEQLPDQISDISLLVVRSTKVSADAINSASQLGLIIRAGSGVNTIDVSAASAVGIHVANCPGTNANAVAELTIGLLIAADRRIVDAACSLRDGKWMKKEFGQARGLRGRTLGLLGFGSIAKSVARIALGMEMRVIAWSRSLTPEVAKTFGVECAADMLQIADSDAVSIHLPSNEQTRHLVGKEFLSRMTDNVILVNTSRGELVDTDTLKAAIETKRLRAALDVFEDEPAGGENVFADSDFAKRITATPHIGASTDQTSEAIADQVVLIAREFLTTGHPPGSVNLCLHSSATHQLVVRHLNQVGVLASVLDALREENINVQEMENSIFEGDLAARCTLRTDAVPSEALLKRLAKNNTILQISSG